MRAAEAARKFVTPDSGPSPYRNDARPFISRRRTPSSCNAVQHVEDVMNGAVDTRIPNDLSGMVIE